MFNLFNFLLEDTTPTGCDSSKIYTYVILGLLAVCVIVMLVMPMFTRKKQQEERNNTKNSLCKGDKIKTIGGIVGYITAINTLSNGEKEIVIDSGEGDSKSSLTLDIQALYMIMERGEEYKRIQAEKTEVEEPVVEDTTSVDEPVAEDATSVEEPVVEDTTSVEEPVAEEPIAGEDIDK